MRTSKGWKFRLKWILLGVSVSAMAVAAVAQAPPPLPPDGAPFMHGPGPLAEALHGDIGEGKTVTGVPLTADIVVSHDNVLADGNRIHKETQTRLYRDSQGRIRREMTIEINTPTTGTVKRTMVMIKDPVSGKRYMLDPGNKTARELRMGRGHGRGAGPGGPPPDMAGAPTPPLGKSVQEQPLGTKSINGIQAEGVRVTRTIAAGEIGNAKPIEVVTERWYSSDLQLPVLISHTDPMMGTVTTTLTNVVRGDPDASLFQLPSDYKVVGGGPGEPFYVPLQPK